jgi:hypothetical protein
MSAMETCLRHSGILVASGLLVQILTFGVAHPLAFVVFLALGCPLVAGGVVLFLLGLLSAGTAAKTKAIGSMNG